jgi:hypothetical protein
MTPRAGPVAGCVHGALLGTTLLAGAGCGSTDLRQASVQHASGRFERAAESILPIEPQGQDRIWVLLERGKLLQDAGRWRESNEAFESAWRIRQSLDDAALISGLGAANTTVALLTDDRAIDYEGTSYDRILMRSATLLNHLMLGEIDLAAVVARSVLAEQRRLREEDGAARRSEARQRLSALAGGEVSLDRIEQDPAYRQARSELGSLRSAVSEEAWLPGVCFLVWLALMADGDPAQAEGARRWFAEAGGDGRLLDTLREMTRTGRLDAGVFVYFEAGLAPVRAPRALHLYLGPAGVVKVPLPVLRPRGVDPDLRLRLAQSTDSVRTEPIASVEAAVVREFDDHLFLIWGRPALSAAIKATATAVAHAQTEGEVRPLVWILGSLWSLAAQPDLRIWSSLPAQLQTAFLPRHDAGAIRVELVAGGSATARRSLDPPPGPLLLFARSTARGTLTLHTAPLYHPSEPRP